MSKSSEKHGGTDLLTATDVARQAELVAMEYLKSMKCTQTLDAMMQKSKSKSSAVVASELYAADLDSKKKAPQEFKSILEYMVSTSSARIVSESSASEGGDGSAPTSRSSRRRSSSLSSDSEMIETIWTKVDISKLKKAIKQTSEVEDKNERWKEIALLVGSGKSKKQCYVKYKELKVEKKAAGSTSSSSRASSPSSSSRRASIDVNKSGKALITAGGGGGGQKEPENVKTAKPDETRAKPSTPPLSSSAPRSSIASELQMEDVEDFDSVHPTTAQPGKQNLSSGSGNFQSSGSSLSSRGGRGGRAPTAEEIASLQQLLFSEDKKGFSSHWDQQVRNIIAFFIISIKVSPKSQCCLLFDSRDSSTLK